LDRKWTNIIIWPRDRASILVQQLQLTILIMIDLRSLILDLPMSDSKNIQLSKVATSGMFECSRNGNPKVLALTKGYWSSGLFISTKMCLCGKTPPSLGPLAPASEVDMQLFHWKHHVVYVLPQITTPVFTFKKFGSSLDLTECMYISEHWTTSRRRSFFVNISR
jgi:hypothetical protein